MLALPTPALRHHRVTLIRQALGAGLAFPAIAEQITSRGLAPGHYGPAHAEWEAWLAYRSYLIPRVWAPWSLAQLDKPSPLSVTFAIILGQAVRDLKRGMPCAFNLHDPALDWPWSSDYHCCPRYHSCAPSAFAFLLSPLAAALFSSLGANPRTTSATILRLKATLTFALPWLTFNILDPVWQRLPESSYPESPKSEA